MPSPASLVGTRRRAPPPTLSRAARSANSPDSRHGIPVLDARHRSLPARECLSTRLDATATTACWRPLGGSLGVAFGAAKRTAPGSRCVPTVTGP